MQVSNTLDKCYHKKIMHELQRNIPFLHSHELKVVTALSSTPRFMLVLRDTEIPSAASLYV